jgi:sigma-E factor negative regulatory protein RseC
MRVNGVVQRVEEGYAWVDVSITQGCGRCQEPGGCGGVNLAKPFGSASRSVRVHNDIDARPGEPVAVLVEDGLPLRGAMLVYGFPVLGLMAGAALGTAAASAGSSADLSAMVGAVAGFLVATLLGRGRTGGAKGSDLPLRLEKAGVSSGGACGR